MIVAVCTVLIVQVPTDDVIEVSGVRHRLVPASCRVAMGRFMHVTVVSVTAIGWVFARRGELVLVEVTVVSVVHMAVVQKIGVVIVLHARVSAPAGMGMVVRLVCLVRHDRIMAPPAPTVQHPF